MVKQSINWQLKTFNDLSVHELYDILQARSDVFVVEQTCIYSDMDRVDKLDGCYHLFGYSGESLVGTCRIMAPGIAYEKHAAIGRVLITEAFRNQQYARDMMEHAIHHVHSLWPQAACKISAQQHLEKFYSSLGFETVTDMYLEDDIPHIGMVLI